MNCHIQTHIPWIHNKVDFICLHSHSSGWSLALWRGERNANQRKRGYGRGSTSWWPRLGGFWITLRYDNYLGREGRWNFFCSVILPSYGPISHCWLGFFPIHAAPHRSPLSLIILKIMVNNLSLVEWRKFLVITFSQIPKRHHALLSCSNI